MNFGKKLKQLLEFEDIPFKVFAEMIHISPSTLSGYLNYGKEPSFELVKTIAATLGVSTDYLLDYNSNQSGSPPISITELTLLTRLRSLPKEKQEIIYKMAEYLTEKPKN